MLLFHISYCILPKLLSQLKNIVCISSSIFQKGILFPFELIKGIQTLEIIFIGTKVSFKVEEFKKITSVLHTPFNFSKTGDNGVAFTKSACAICLKQPRCALGKLFTLTGSPSTWLCQLYYRYISVELHAWERLLSPNF